jgi:hypothetical protein
MSHFATWQVSTEGGVAKDGAELEYGVEGARKLLQWRHASHWSHFVPRMIGELLSPPDEVPRLPSHTHIAPTMLLLLRLIAYTGMIKEHERQRRGNASMNILRFFVAADSDDAYQGLMKQFPTRVIYTQRACATSRCDFRDCSGMIYSLADMMNLARTRLILGSGYSSFSEVAAQMGSGPHGPLQLFLSGRDFGDIVEQRQRGRTSPDIQNPFGTEHPEAFSLAGFSSGKRDSDSAHERHSHDSEPGVKHDEVEEGAIRSVQPFWPKPF